MDPDQVFKTIVLVGERKGPFVCIIPGSCEIDLRKAATAIGDKACSLLPLKELESLTGYVRGGCSPIGMKKRLPTSSRDRAPTRPPPTFAPPDVL